MERVVSEVGKGSLNAPIALRAKRQVVHQKSNWCDYIY